MPKQQEQFPAIFAELRGVLEPFAPKLVLTKDEPDVYYLDTPRSPKYGKPLFFAAVQVKKSYVAFHLMPVYMYPELLDGLSPALRKRMQGKSCFNFTDLGPAQREELAALAGRGFEQMRKEAELPV